MTTTIPSVTTNRTLLFHGSNDLEGPVSFEVVGHGFDSPVVLANRDAFLDAVRTELGVLTIDKAELPKVFIDAVDYVCAWAPGEAERSLPTVDVDNLRQRAYALLAIAEYVEAHPPVDEQQVEALTAALIEAGLREKVVPAMVARRLAESGYRIEKVQS